MYLPERTTFDHIGLITTERRPGEVFEEKSRAWLTSPRAGGANIEWIRWERDSPVEGPLRTGPHLAYRVEDLESALEGHNVVYEPFEIGGGFARIAFVDIDGGLVEFMQYANPEEDGWF